MPSLSRVSYLKVWKMVVETWRVRRKEGNWGESIVHGLEVQMEVPVYGA